MTRWIAAIVLSFGLGTMVYAADSFTQFAVTDTAQNLNDSGDVTAGIRRAVCTTGSGPLRYRIDGTDPVSTAGIVGSGSIVEATGQIVIWQDDLADFNFVRAGAVNTELSCHFYSDFLQDQ